MGRQKLDLMYYLIFHRICSGIQDRLPTQKLEEGRKTLSGERNLLNTNRAEMSHSEPWQAVQELMRTRTAPSVTTTNMPMVNINFTGVCITPASYVPSDNSSLEHRSAICRHKTSPVISLHFSSSITIRIRWVISHETYSPLKEMGLLFLLRNVYYRQITRSLQHYSIKA